MDSFSVAIVTGVISGIVVAAILWLLHQFFIKIFSPWLEQRLYKSTVLTGTWNATTENKCDVALEEKEVSTRHESNRNLTLNLSQKGARLSGTFYAKSNSRKTVGGEEKEKSEYSNQYQADGYVRDNWVILNYSPLSRNRTGLGSIVLQICHGGTKLIGAMAYVGEGDFERISTLTHVQFIRSS